MVVTGTSGQISKKHGNTLIGTLHKVYGSGFAKGQPDHDTLSEALAALDEHSLTQLVHDHDAGHLEGKIAKA